MKRKVSSTCGRFLAIGVLAGASFGTGANLFAADVFAGRSVYEQHCQTCHGEKGTPPDAATPDFSRGETLFASDTELVRKIRKGSGAMPAYRGLLSDDEIRDVVAYLRTLRR